MSKGAGTTRRSSSTSPNGVKSVAMANSSIATHSQSINISATENREKSKIKKLSDAMYSSNFKSERFDNIEKVLNEFPIGTEIEARAYGREIVMLKVKALGFDPDWRVVKGNKDYGYLSSSVADGINERKIIIRNIK